jgi:hypothetical protein
MPEHVFCPEATLPLDSSAGGWTWNSSQDITQTDLKTTLARTGKSELWQL